MVVDEVFDLFLPFAAQIGGFVVLAGQSASGRLTAVITDTALVLPYLAFAAVCAAIAWAATRNPRGTS